MANELVPLAKNALLCGDCGQPLVCRYCYSADVVLASRTALSEVVRGVGGRNAAARVTAAKLILSRDYLEHLSDEDLRAEVMRRQKK